MGREGIYKIERCRSRSGGGGEDGSGGGGLSLGRRRVSPPLRYDHKASDEWNHAPFEKGEELESLRLENRRPRNLLQQSLELLQDLSESPCLSPDCPADLYDHLVSTINSENFMTQLKLLHESVDETGSKFPFKEASGMELQSAEELVDIGLEEPSWRVWVTDDLVPSDVEGLMMKGIKLLARNKWWMELRISWLDASFSERKALTLTPEELQKTLNKALKRTNKLERCFIPCPPGDSLLWVE